jgi:hypothetical protein
MFGVRIRNTSFNISIPNLQLSNYLMKATANVTDTHQNNSEFISIRQRKGMHGGGERCLQGFGWEAPRLRDLWEDLGLGGRIIVLRWTLRRYGSMGRTEFGWFRIWSSGEPL